MSNSTSIIQEYNKVQEHWKETLLNKKWKLAIWLIEYEDTDLVNSFLEIERSPTGFFDDIFFRFDSKYTGDDESFEKDLWEEFKGWFSEDDPKWDFWKTLKREKLLENSYEPNLLLPPTAANLWKELLRLKKSIPKLNNNSFCIYFPPKPADYPKMKDWFSDILEQGIPNGIRLISIDFKTNRPLKIRPSSKVIIIEPELKTIEAINNDINRECDSYNTISVEDRFRKQIKIVLDHGAKKDKVKIEKEISTLLELSEEITSKSLAVTGLLIASQAFYFVKEYDKSEKHIDNALEEAKILMNSDDPSGYLIWKGVMMQKGALCVVMKDRKKAIEVYEYLGDEASKRADPFYAMEGYRLTAHMYYELGKLNTAFEIALLSLFAGSFLEKEMKRQSTFLLVASLALHIGEKTQSEHKLSVLKQQLHDWLGDNWQELLQSEELKKSTARNKASFFEKL